ncbi:MAG TPA: hypothetical protein VHN99_07780 [Deinococcales bacterium]|nr:hypothetical protein [Deinococcales bacterium]
MTAASTQWVSLALLVGFGALLLARVLGVMVPAWTLAAVLAAHLAVRTYLDLTFGGPEGRRRAPANAIVSLAVIALLLFAVR